MGATPLEIDWKKVEELMMAGCHGVEIAGYLGIHPNTLYIRVEEKYKCGYREFLHEKKSKGESLLRAHQYAKALGLTDKGDNTLLIWLGKTRLEQRESQANTNLAPNSEVLHRDQRIAFLEEENRILKNAQQPKTEPELRRSE